MTHEDYFKNVDVFDLSFEQEQNYELENNCLIIHDGASTSQGMAINTSYTHKVNGEEVADKCLNKDKSLMISSYSGSDDLGGIHLLLDNDNISRLKEYLNRNFPSL